ncbi:MobF family relaxase [Arthrobacter bambusae]|uniref:MobF family relaxase n=1 Tax=Arthrobacter bambusae TaxID=1338426 RepID=UPI00277DC265|nr:MobF family relaxase [Arthrobacter bambusae]MDQ0031507.1 conjugative relaxase-like TrwC/TraI family protein [Arthrobacter bambusae]MDQ0099730.1 conjugative relaxase-like TrwC/TraI family protein [Arthrobacter bambusae]
MMTVHKLSAGDGYTYYTREVASADELRAADRSLGDYYTVDGNPPGQWGGAGLSHLGVSGEVTESQMAALFGEGLHPDAEKMLADDPKADVRLGARYPRYRQKDNELRARVDRALGDYQRMNHREPDADTRRQIRMKEGAQYFRELNGRNPSDKEELGRFVTAQTKPGSQAVAGYDLVFAPAKSASVLWAIGGEEARKEIEAAHHEAIEETMQYLEREATFTRRGRNGVRQEDIEGGLIYTRFRHYDSRNGDPQLHDHVVVSNKVLGADGKWSSLDGRLLYQFNVAASEHYNRTVMEKICARLGVGLVERKVGGDRPVVEIAGVDVAAIEAASSRREGIKPVLDQLVADFTEDHGYAPNSKQLIALAQQATLDTRAAKKEARQLATLVAEWTEELGSIPGVEVGPAAVEKARAHRHDARENADQDNPQWMVAHADEIDPAQEAEGVIHTLERSRGVWGEHHIDAEVRRRLGSRLGELPIPPALLEQVKARAIDQFSLRITPETPTPEIAALRLKNGASKYGKAHSTLYTSSGILHSEDRLLTAAQRVVIPAATTDSFNEALAKQDKTFDAGQLRMAKEFSCGDRLLIVGVGPAGAGKTTALKLAADTVREAGGRVIGLAPTAVAAAVMGTELGAKATTIDSFVLGHQTDSPQKVVPKPGDMIIIDEAGMVGTQMFAAAVTIADQYGAVIRALGDDQQLSAVGSGGALRLLKNTVGAVHLEDLHRFRNADGTANDAESTATLALREPPTAGQDDPWTFYRENRRVVGGDAETMTSQVFTAWQRDTDDGKHSVMMAYDNATVTELNARAQAYRLGNGSLKDGPAATLRDGLTARAGDIIVTRENNRRLATNRGKDFVKNNDVWTVREVHEDGAMTVRHDKHGGTITLPADYVRAKTMLGYAATIHRTQGITCDTTHALISSGLSRSLAYVAASRGRQANNLYGVVSEGETLEGVLESVAANHDGNLTAHEQMDAARAQTRSLPEMSEAYRDIDHQANELRMANVARRELGEGTAAPFIKSDAWGAIATHLRAAENDGFNIAHLLKDSVGEGAFEASDSPGAVLAWRVEDRLQRWRAQSVDPGHRPLQSLSDEALARLEHRSAVELRRAQEAARTPSTDAIDRATLLRGWKAENKDTPWQRRLHGHLSDDDLASRLAAVKQDARTDSTINDPAASRKARWLESSLQKELQLREQMHPEARADEAYERGAGTNYRREANASRTRTAAQLHRRIRAEIELRRQLPQPAAATPADDQLPAWMAPADVLTHPDTPALWQQELHTRRDLMATEVTRLGAQLVAEPPAWAAALGPVPSAPSRQEQWRLLAVEIATYRDTYRIPATETKPLPETHRGQGVGADLSARITAMHKYSAQTAKEPLAPADAALMAEAAQVEAVVKETPTPAEHVVDHLRETRGTETQLSPAQERAERMAALARKVRENRAKNQRADEDSRNPEAVKEALDQIKARRAQEQARREETRRGHDDPTPRQDRGPGIGR